MPQMNATDSFLSPVTRQILKHFVSYVSIVFICAGILGNFCSLVIFFKNRTKDRVSSQYLSVLAVSDLISLCVVATIAWTFSHLHEVSHGRFVMTYQMPNDLGCQAWAFVWNVFAFTSAWIVVVFGIERCLVIWQPLKMAPIVSSSKPRRTAMVVIFISGLLVGSPHFYWNVLTPIPGDRFGCLLRRDLTPQLLYLATFCIFGPAFGIPLVIICITNILILIGIKRNKMSDDSKSKSDSRTDLRCLINLLGVSFMYILTNTPLVVMCVIFPVLEQNQFRGYSPQGVQDLLTLMLTSHAFSHMNFACNPLVYTFSLDYYRAELKRLFCWWRKVKKAEMDESAVTGTSGVD